MMVAARQRPSAAQIRLYHVLARRLGWSEEDRHAFLRRNLGHESSNQVSRSQLSDVIDWQQYVLGMESERPRWRPEGPSRGQLAMIQGFARLPCPEGWHVHPARNRVMMRRLARRDVANVEELTRAEASKFIEFLKAVFKRNRARTGRPAPAVSRRRSVYG